MRDRVEALIDEIQGETLMTRGFTGIAAISPAVLDALRATPRESFVDIGNAPFAYLNQPLPIRCGQTISQPFIVALMTQALQPQGHHRVLEIGCGSGYQAAVLAQLVDRVVSVEIIAELAASAGERLRTLAVGNVEVHCADGWHGWPPASPYDGIIVTACARRIPPALTEQLRPGGRLVIPVGEPHGFQELLLVDKAADQSLRSQTLLQVAFVPFTRAPESACGEETAAEYRK